MHGNLAYLADNAGYADQAYMCREVRALAHETPQNLLTKANTTLAMSDLFNTSTRLPTLTLFSIGRRNMMKPQITVLTIGVDSLERSLAFYRDGLGLQTEGIIGKEFEHGQVVFFELQGGLKLALFERGNIAHDAGVPVSGRSPTEFTIGHNVGSKERVDAIMAQAKAAGARITKEAQETFWGGYGGYFQDPDGHLWEVIWNPAWEA